MNIIVNSKLNACYPNLSKPTLITYTSNVCNILDLVNASNPDYLYKNYEDVIKKIKKEHKYDNTQKNKFAACNSIIKCYITNETKSEVENAIQKYIDEINILKNKIKTDLKTHIASSKEKESWLTKEQAKKIDTILESKVKDKIENYDDFIPLRDLVLFRFYQQISTRAELSEALFYYNDEIDINDLDKNFNYIILNKQSKQVEYYIFKHKTFKKVGSRYVVVKGKLYNLLVKYKKHIGKFYNEHNENYFMLNLRGMPMSYTTLSQTYAKLGNVINIVTSIRCNRHIKATNKINIDVIEKVANELGHSVEECLAVYVKRR
jgi:hypothetical protein